MRKRAVFVAIAVAALSLKPLSAADHRDGPAAKADPAADINDLFAWMSPDARDINLAMTVFPFAGAGAEFSDQVQYVFHTSSRSGFGTGTVTDVDAICEFNRDQRVQCWVGNDGYVSGDASATGGISSADGKIRVFAGLRNDPFFLNMNGFNSARQVVITAAPSLQFDTAGCPQLDSGTASGLQTQLRSEPDGSPAQDDFLHANTLILVLQIEKSLLTTGGPVVGVWAGTYSRG